MLTKEQQDFITEQYKRGIIKGFFHYYPNLSEEEYSGLACIGLCKCIPNYNEEKGKFSTFAYKYMLNEILRYIQGLNTQKRKIEVLSMSSLDYELNDKKGNTETEGDLISDNVDYEQNIVDDICLSQKLRLLNDKQKSILNLILLGFKQREIGSRLKVTQQCVNFHMNKIKQIIKQEYTLESI